jgi:hypothetical protein
MNVPDGNTLVNKVEINLNMLGALVLNGVSEEVDGADIVTVDQSGPRQSAPQAVDEASTPLPHCWSRCSTPVSVGRPGDEIVAQEHRVA